MTRTVHLLGLGQALWRVIIAFCFLMRDDHVSRHPHEVQQTLLLVRIGEGS
jgi:hypothetical protein